MPRTRRTTFPRVLRADRRLGLQLSISPASSLSWLVSSLPRLRGSLLPLVDVPPRSLLFPGPVKHLALAPAPRWRQKQLVGNTGAQSAKAKTPRGCSSRWSGEGGRRQGEDRAAARPPLRKGEASGGSRPPALPFLLASPVPPQGLWSGGAAPRTPRFSGARLKERSPPLSLLLRVPGPPGWLAWVREAARRRCAHSFLNQVLVDPVRSHSARPAVAGAPGGGPGSRGPGPRCPVLGTSHHLWLAPALPPLSPGSAVSRLGLDIEGTHVFVSLFACCFFFQFSPQNHTRISRRPPCHLSLPEVIGWEWQWWTI